MSSDISTAAATSTTPPVFAFETPRPGLQPACRTTYIPMSCELPSHQAWFTEFMLTKLASYLTAPVRGLPKWRAYRAEDVLG